MQVDRQPVYRCKSPEHAALAQHFDAESATIADKIRYARITARLEQAELAELVGIDRTTLLRLENGQVSDEHMRTDTLVKIAVTCNRRNTFCCDEYHAFMAGGYGAVIRRVRKAYRWTQAELAALMRVSVTTVKRWEQERSRPSRANYHELIVLAGDNQSSGKHQYNITQVM